MSAFGFVVTGVPQAAIEEAKAAFARREAMRAEAAQGGAAMPRRLKSPEERKYRRVIVFGPTIIKAAADDALALAAKSGYIDTRIEERG